MFDGELNMKLYVKRENENGKVEMQSMSYKREADC